MIKHYQSMTFTTKVQWFTTLTASYPEVQCPTAYQVVICLRPAKHPLIRFYGLSVLIETGSSFQSLLKSLLLQWCKLLACRATIPSWRVQTVHLSFSKYQADVLCFYYYQYPTQAGCTWVANVSKISNESFQLLNCSKTGLIEDPPY